MSMPLHPLAVAFYTHQGLVRSNNQDSFRVDAELAVTVLADGMGGHCNGEVASRVAVEASISALMAAQRVDDGDAMQSLLQVGQAVEMANQSLLDMIAVHPELAGMGTTLVAAIFRERRIFFAHVGDSRLYRLRKGRLWRLTRDHSLIQQLIDEGIFMSRAEARAAGVRENVLTRSLGMHQHADVDVGDALLERNDLFLLSSDGLHGLLSDEVITRILCETRGGLDDQVQNLVEAALAAGGNDNVTVILACPQFD